MFSPLAINQLLGLEKKTIGLFSITEKQTKKKISKRRRGKKNKSFKATSRTNLGSFESSALSFLCQGIILLTGWMPGLLFLEKRNNLNNNQFVISKAGVCRGQRSEFLLCFLGEKQPKFSFFPLFFPMGSAEN